MYSGDNGCIRVRWLNLGKSGIISSKVVLFRQKLLYSGKSGCIRESGYIRSKVLVFGQK